MEYDEDNFAKYFLPDGIADEVPIQRKSPSTYQAFQANRNSLLSTLGGAVHQPSNMHVNSSSSSMHSQIGQFRSSPGTIGSKGPPPGLSPPSFHHSERAVQQAYHEDSVGRHYPINNQLTGYALNEPSGTHSSSPLQSYQTNADLELSTFRMVENAPYTPRNIGTKGNTSGIIGPPITSYGNRDQLLQTHQYALSRHSGLHFNANSTAHRTQLDELNSSSSVILDSNVTSSTNSVIGTRIAKTNCVQPSAEVRSDEHMPRVKSPRDNRRASFPQSNDHKQLTVKSPDKKVWAPVSSPKPSDTRQFGFARKKFVDPVSDKVASSNATTASVRSGAKSISTNTSEPHKVYQPVKANEKVHKVATASSKTSEKGKVSDGLSRKQELVSSQISQRKPSKDNKPQKEKEFKRERPKAKKERKLERCHSSPPRTSATMHEEANRVSKQYVPSILDKLVVILQSFPLFQTFYQRYFGSTSLSRVLSNGISNANSIMLCFFGQLALAVAGGFKCFLYIHRYSLNVLLMNHHVAFSFTFLYAFPYLVQYIIPWAPPWAPVCLWYAFLVQLFCTNGPRAMVSFFRLILPLVFLLEGVSHHSFLLDLNGAELLLISFILSALKTRNVCSPVFFLSVAAQCLSAVFLGSHLAVQWGQLTLALFSLHNLTIPDDEWLVDGGDFKRKALSYLQVPPYSSAQDSVPSSTARRVKRPDRRRKLR